MRRAILEKQRKVQELRSMVEAHRTVMIANIENVPARMLHTLRSKLRGRALIKVYKNVIIRRALEGLRDSLIPFIEGHPSAVILTNEDPLTIYREIISVVEYAPLRPGKPAPEDITIEPGPVPVPVTMLSELKAAGLPVRSMKGSVQLEKEYKIPAGKVIDERLARALELMDVRPIKIFLRVVAAHSDGLLFREDVLSISPADVLEEIKLASRHAFNLAFNAGYPTKQTLPFIIADAHRKALSLAVAAGYVTKETLPALLSLARARALALSLHLPPEFQDEGVRAMVEEKEEKREEEKKEEKEEEPTAGLAALFG